MTIVSKLKRLLGPNRVQFTCQLGSMKRFDIGDWTYGTPRVLSWGEKAELIIGKYCSIAENVTIMLGGSTGQIG